MTRRKFYRSCSLALVVLCWAGWTRSYTQETYFQFCGAGSYTLNMRRGEIAGQYLGPIIYFDLKASGEVQEKERWDSFRFPGFSFVDGPIDTKEPYLATHLAPYQLAGFAFGYHRMYALNFFGAPTVTAAFAIAIPWWFVTGISSLLAYRVWRKTRLGPATAFSVDLKPPG